MLNPEALRKKDNWAIVDSFGNIIQKFRLNNTAEKWLENIKKDYPDELKIEKI